MTRIKYSRKKRRLRNKTNRRGGTLRNKVVDTFKNGIMKYANGDVYEGEWKNGKKEGQGVMTYANGNVYDGHWKNGKKEGEGIFYKQGQPPYFNVWIDDQENFTLEKPEEFELEIKFFSISYPERIKFTLYVIKKMPIERSFLCYYINKIDKDYENKGCLTGINMNMAIGQEDIEFKPIKVWGSLDLTQISGSQATIVYSYHLPELKN